jgi:uncharacterized protein (DUF1800 family)
MADAMMAELALALNRFGLGARGDEVVPRDPRAMIKRQFDAYQPKPAALAGLPTRVQIATSLVEYLDEARKLGRKQVADDGAKVDSQKALRQLVRKDARGHHVAQVGARMRAAVASETPFVERMVHFWANHFAVSADKLATIGLAGTLEFDAVRPHVLGRFGDMLRAAVQHPAMLLYLDQAQSIGPESQVGARIAERGRRKVGLNENLAREILELHTLGVRTGYSQSDVTEFARAMTGWTVTGISKGPIARAVIGTGTPGDFTFVPLIHQPGTRTILGRSYAQVGELQALAVLNDLAIHPATADHIATKIARHFAGDTPPPALVARLKANFLKTGGDLPSLYATLVDAPEAWTSAPTKFKTPWEWGVSAFRALGIRQFEDQNVVGMLTQLGQPVWRPKSPAGYDDVAASWAGPDALMKRVDVAQRLAVRAPTDARLLATKLFPATLSKDTAAAIANADSGAQALALLLVAPEFLRR